MHIILVDEQTLFRCTLKAYLDGHQDLEVVGDASSGEEGLRLLESRACDLVIAELNLEDFDGVRLIRAMRLLNPVVPILVLSTCVEVGAVSQALAVGANGYVVKSAHPEELMSALTIVASGGAYIHPKVARALFNPPQVSTDDLTPRERAVLELLVNGASNERVARVLHVSVSTVKGHLRSLFAKFGVADRTHLVAEAVSRGVVQTRASAETRSV